MKENKVSSLVVRHAQQVDLLTGKGNEWRNAGHADTSLANRMGGNEEAGLIVEFVLSSTDGREGTRVLIRSDTLFPRLSRLSESHGNARR